MDGNLRYWVALNMLGSAERFNVERLLEAFGSPEALFRPGASIEPFSRGLAQSVARFTAWDRVDKDIERADRSGARIVSFIDPEYPAALRRVYDPPCLLYMMGRPFPDSSSAVAVVGTRRPTPYGLHMAESLGRELGAAGVAVVSGMARGCDTAAHKGALSSGGTTVAVLGTGADTVYPKESARLYNEILEKGVVVSEYPMSTPPLPHNFPRRNRIISGLSLGVAVVEAPLRSGSLMTARLALEYGREVFAVPGQVTSNRSAGANRLLKEGAGLVESAADILDALSIERAAPAEERTVEVSGEERTVFESLGAGPVNIETLIEKTGLTAARASTILLEMELKGLVEKRPGMLFTRRP